MAAEPVELQIARLEGAYDQINHRLGRIESELSALRSSVDTKFYWMIGLILVSILLPQVQHYVGR